MCTPFHVWGGRRHQDRGSIWEMCREGTKHDTLDCSDPRGHVRREMGLAQRLDCSPPDIVTGREECIAW